MRHSNGKYVPLNHLNCKWTCARGINNQNHSVPEGIIISSYDKPKHIFSMDFEVPARCECSCKDPQGGEDKTAYISVSAHGE